MICLASLRLVDLNFKHYDVYDIEYLSSLPEASGSKCFLEIIEYGTYKSSLPEASGSKLQALQH